MIGIRGPDEPVGADPECRLGGLELGVRKASAQVTVHYRPEDLVGRLVVAVVNFPSKQIGPLMSECLVTGFHDADGAVALCVPDKDVPPGTRLL